MTIKTYEKIALKIEDLISNGNYPPGKKIPAERKLALEYMVSRNTIREAIKVLVEKKIIVSRTGSGNFISENAGNIIARSLEESSLKRKNRLREVFELRKILEPAIASIAAEKISQDLIISLDEIIIQQEKSSASKSEYKELDVLFHKILVRSTANSVLYNVYEKIHDILSESREFDLLNPERIRKSIKNHKKILKALKEGNSLSAYKFMMLHMEEIEKTLI